MPPERVRLIRQVTFSSGHRFWSADLSSEENRALFSPYASPYNHGHNYVLQVSAEGRVDPENGMVVNIKDIDQVLERDIISVFDGKSMNDEVPEFGNTPPTLENVATVIRNRLVNLPKEVELTGLRLEEMPTLWITSEQEEDWKMKLTRTYEFAASHRLFNPNLSDDENERLFGKCANAAGHGHNYVLEVTVSGPTDPKTGMLVDLNALDAAVEKLVIDRYDHRNLNTDLDEFRGKMTTSEAVLQQIWQTLNGALPAKLEKLRLLETARSVFEVSA